MAKATVIIESTKPLLGGGADVVKLEISAQGMPGAAAGAVDHLCRLYGKDWAAGIDRLRELCGMPKLEGDAHLEALRARDDVIEQQAREIQHWITVGKKAEEATVLAQETIAKQVDALTTLRLEMEELARYEPATVGRDRVWHCSACEALTAIAGDESEATYEHGKSCAARLPEDEPTRLTPLYVERVDA